MTTPTNNILNEAHALVTGDRQEAYGDCSTLHKRIANLFNAYMDGKDEVSTYDAAMFMMLVKIGRARHLPSPDTHRDIAGYASICQSIFDSVIYALEEEAAGEENGGS